GHDVNIAGAPVVIDELNRLGGRESNKKFFFISLGICLCLLYFQLRDWRMTGMILALTMFATQLTVAILKWCGGEMNFVIDALPVMVMVFTLEVCVHLLSYYVNAEGSVDRFQVMFHHAVKPCFLATFTTAIGSLSLCVSEFIPVRQFGWAGTLGSLVALAVGLVLTPAVIAVCPPHRRNEETAVSGWFVQFSDWFLVRSRQVVGVGIAATLLCGIGMMWLYSHIDPLEFFPKNSVVLRDVRRIQAELTNTDTIETTVDFGRNPQLASLPFVAKLDFVRQLEAKIGSHPRISHTTSLASMFPSEMPSGLALTQLLDRAMKRQKDNDFLAGGEQYWRISANLNSESRGVGQKTLEELQAILADAPVTLTGISPLIEQAQKDIYVGFWSSFVYAFWSIMLVMIVSLKWFNAGFIGMLPNLAPIAIVFGFLGWIGHPVDISMMMSGSIALGSTCWYATRKNWRRAETKPKPRESPCSRPVRRSCNRRSLCRSACWR
ncbi:MAG: exporter of the RND superfamily protein-like protein, partial [Planctomycetota bacterium]